MAVFSETNAQGAGPVRFNLFKTHQYSKLPFRIGAGEGYLRQA